MIIHELLKNREIKNTIDDFCKKHNEVIFNQKIDFNKIFNNNNGIEVFNCGEIYNLTLLDYLAQEKWIISEYFKTKRTFIFSDDVINFNQSDYFRLLRSLGVFIIQPYSDNKHLENLYFNFKNIWILKNPPY